MKSKHDFLLHPEITFLNFGSFGACPIPVFENYQYWQRQLELEPVQHIAYRGEALLQNARISLAGFLGAEADEVVFTPNPTYALNLVIKSLQLQKDDEILTTNLEYGAMDRAWKFYSEKKGWKYIRQNIQLPIVSEDQFESDFWKGYNEKTKVIFLSHITSATGLILPIERIIKRANELGLLTIIDGAHAPAHIDLNLSNLEAHFYAGACHKWMLAPKGSSFLFAKKCKQNLLEPLIVSWGYESDQPSNSLFIDHNQYVGTKDFSSYLAVPRAIEYMNENNWEQVRLDCRALLREGMDSITHLMESHLLAPAQSSFYGQLCSVPIKTHNPKLLKQKLYEQYKIEIPVVEQEGSIYLRYSIQIFNDWKDIETLLSAVHELKFKEGLIA